MSSHSNRKTSSFAALIFGGVVCFVCLILITLGHSFEQSVQERNNRASLYSQMVEETLSRTFEALEVTLSSLASEFSKEQLNSEKIAELRGRLIESLRFAPQLRQIVVIKDGATLIDTRQAPALDINEAVLGFDENQVSQFSLGMMIGTQIRGRFFPYKGYFPDEAEYREIVPIGLDFISDTGESFRIIAAFNPSYIKRTIRELPLHDLDRVYITDLESNSLIQHGLFGPYQAQVRNLITEAISEGVDVLQSDKRDGYLPENTTTVQLGEKYPIAVALVTSHKGSLQSWVREKSNLLVIIFMVTLSMFFGAGFIVRSNRRALEMGEEVHLLSEVVEHTPTVIVITDSKGLIKYVNESFERETGYSRSDVIGCNPNILKSGDKTERDYQEMWRQLQSGQTWMGEFHNKRKDGSLYWERASIGPLKDSNGDITHFIALKQPIDKEKQAEQKQRLASTVFDSATEAIMVTNTDKHIEMVNPAFQQITGYSEKEVLGKTPSLLKSGKHSAEFYDSLYHVLKERGAWEGEIWNRRKDGEIYPQWLMISSRYDQEGNLEGYVALFADITKRKKDEALIRQQANYDSITALPNRNLFTDRLNQALSIADRNKTKTALLFIDLDRFKYVNDTYGHHMGDLLLQQVADRLRAEVRKSDTVARLGGDEFAVIISNLQQQHVVEKVATKILDSLAKPYQLNENEAFISCSIGIAFYPDHSTRPETLIVNADSAMYKAKKKGRNTHEYFNEALNRDFNKRRSIEKDLYQALKRDEFFLVYQPIWNIDRTRVESVEALIRWKHPEKGLIPPVHFIPLAEESSLIHEIGDWVIERCCQFAKRLQDNYSHPPKISFNVSSLQFMRSGLDRTIKRELDRNGIKGSALTVEITESVLLIDEKKIDDQLFQIESMGMQISVDDFGTGFSSLSYLKKYPIQRIKIDRSFIQDLERDSDGRALVAGIISLANSLSLQTVVEGVETEGQLALIREYGDPLIQGYLFNKPMTDENLMALLNEK